MVDAMKPWADFGLTGLVIGALFVTLWATGRSILLRILEMQKDERREWIESFKLVTQQIDLRQQESNEVIRDLTKAVNDMNNRRRLIDTQRFDGS
jgi:hypothetical protein